MRLSWADFKAFATSKSIQWIEMDSTYYHLHVYDGPVIHECKIAITDPANDDQTDFETNYKANGNKSLAQQFQPFSSKTLPNGKNLFKRLIGITSALVSGSNTVVWTQAAFPWVKFTALEVVGGETGDTCSVIILDTATGAYSGHANYPLNQFSWTANIAPNFYRYTSEYDADLYQNLQIQFVYTSISAKTIGINLDLNEVKA